MTPESTNTKDSGQRVKMGFFNPFPGLRPFNFDESHLFFGREGQSDEILNNLAKHRFAAVIGASGSGKSSLMYCGVIPVLHGGFMTTAGSEWTVIVTRPGRSPIDNLIYSIINNPDLSEEVEEAGLERAYATLRRSSLGLSDVVQQMTRGARKNIFVLIDQFEELFRFLDEGEDRLERFNEAAFYVNLLIRSISQKEVPVYVAITMRSDYIGACSQFPELTHLINKSHYLIPQMVRAQKKSAIEGPIAVAGAKIAPRLVQQLLNDIGNKQDQLPVLQHALMRTWEHWQQRNEPDEPIDITDYVAIGRIDEALSQHANEIYDALDEEEKRICEILFKALTEKGPDNQGIRRAEQLSEIALIANVPEEQVIKVIDRFKSEGGSLLMTQGEKQGALTSETVVEISHESLMRIWNRLRVWVDEEAESANQYIRLSDAAERYQLGRSGLWRPPELDLAWIWYEKQQPTSAWAKRYKQEFERAINFLKYSHEEHEREIAKHTAMERQKLRRTKNFATVLGIAAIISIIFFIFGWIKKMDADEQRIVAIQAKERAIEQQKIAEMRRQEAETQRLKAQQQTELAIRARAEAVRQAQLAEAARQEAERQAGIATKATIEAIAAAKTAEQKQQEALAAERLAQEQREMAYRLRMLSVAQSMSVKSLTVKDLDLKVLLAYQAFQFNAEYDGDEFDNYIYDGLYYAKKQKVELRKGVRFNAYRQHSDMIRAIVYSKDGQRIYTTGSDGKVLEWNARTFKTNTLVPENNHINYTLRLSDDENWLVVAGDAPYILKINLKNGEFFKITGHRGPVTDVVFLPGSDSFISLGIADSTLRLNTGTSSSLFKKFDVRLTALTLSPDGSVLVGGNEMGAIIIWDMNNTDHEEKFSNITSRPIYALSFNPRGDILAVGNEDGEVTMCSYRNLSVQSYYVLRGQESRINSIGFSRDGKLIATASLDGTIQLWVLENNRMERMLPVAFKDHNDFVWSIAFSPSGNYLFAGTRDGTLKIWPTRPELLADDVCKYLIRNMTRQEWERYVGEDIPYVYTCDQVGIDLNGANK